MSCRLSLLALDVQFVADLAGADQDALGVRALRVSGTTFRNSLLREIVDRRAGIGMAQHALGREDDQRLAPVTQRLPAQQVEILRGVGGLADLDVVPRCELQEALDARAGVFRALAFVAVRQQQHQAGKQFPLVFAGADELIDDCLRDVDEVAELRFPQDQRFGIVAAVAVFEAHHAGFGESGVVDFATRPGRARCFAAERIPVRSRCR